MLYIFHVDTGTMMTFDMNLALESVVQLKEAIDRTCRIPTDKQVLLVSGGESLDPAARVCSYSAGTDTNPIYLFSKTTIESTTPPSPSVDSGSDMDLKDQVDGSLSMPATYNTVVVRAQLAQQFCELAREQTRACERLVHDQHLQQQGWSAVVANLEDITVLFRSHAEMFEQSFTQYLGSRAESMVLIQSFSQDLEVLSKIPIIPDLLKDRPEHNRAALEDKGGSGEQERNKEIEHGEGEGDCTQESETVTLLQWIAVTDDQSGLEQISDACIQGLNKFDDRMFETLKSEIMTTFEGANKTDYKEIKGLEERLYGLEQLMFEAKQLVQEQSDLAQSFLQNQNRASNLGDPSILPDLCASHRRQLLVMLKNHQQLIGIRRRCSKAKEELCINLYHRLRWIMYVENNMFDLERRLNLYHDGLKRLRRRLEVVQQIHLAPTMYLTAVGEVVRRRTFSQSFLVWASDLACQLLAVHSDEVSRRRDFQLLFADHFLNSLFPGLGDVPPPFATEAPPPFDTDLPPLNVAHIDKLRRQIPDLVRLQNWPDLAAISQFFLVKVKPDSMEERLVKTLVGGKCSTSPTNYMHSTITNKEQQDSRGFESETDTEEFEKVTASPMDVTFDPKSPSSVIRRQSSVTVIATLEENLGSTRNEVDRLHGLLSVVGRTACDGTAALRDELSVLRAQAIEQRETFLALYCQLVAAWRGMEEERAVREREMVQRLTVDHELEMDALKKEIKHCADGKDDEIRLLKCNALTTEKEVNDLRSDMERRLEEEVRERRDVARSLETELTETRQHCTQLQLRLESSEIDKQRAIKEVSDRLAHDYKTELENLRSRFRLMATQSMERSPSDSSLEKIDRADFIELANHEAIVAQLRDDLANEGERTVEEAQRAERTKWEARLDQELKQARTRTEQEKQVWFNEAMRRVVGDKDRQLEALRARESSLVSECQQHQETIQRVTEKGRSSGGGAESGVMMWPLLDRVEVLEAEKAALEAELAEERRRKKTASESDGSFDMSASVAVVTENVFRDAATSPDLQGEQAITQKLTRSTTALIQQGKISIMSCNAGDAVLVVWNEDHNNYTILQEMATLYFLHSDCVDSLGLKTPVDGATRRMYATGEVTEKEYCHAKKPENRYRVPKGTKFYRVKVRPLQKESLMVRSHHHHHHHTAPSGSAHQSGTL